MPYAFSLLLRHLRHAAMISALRFFAAIRYFSLLRYYDMLMPLYACRLFISDTPLRRRFRFFMPTLRARIHALFDAAAIDAMLQGRYAAIFRMLI